jgi:DNA-directed RNA polymerase specialized sigma24 family protein
LGYKLSEIGELKNSSSSATQSRLQRARKEFRRRSECPISRRKP